MNVVKDLLDRTSISQKELAVEIGVSQPTVSDWIHNKKDPRGKNLQKLASYFRVSLLVIKGIEPIPKDRLQYNPTRPIPQTDDDDHKVWQLREEYRRDPNRRMLFSLSNNGSAKDVRQVAAIIDVLKATNPDFYDGDDPA